MSAPSPSLQISSARWTAKHYNTNLRLDELTACIALRL
jgi:hypothetical protein